MHSIDFLSKSKELVAEYTNSHKEGSSELIDPDENVYVVWYRKTLLNHKALLSTNRLDGRYYEMTYNGNRDELYMDVYSKTENKCISLK